MNLPQRIHETVVLIDQQMNHWLPRKAFCAYSGGRDSAVLLDILTRLNHKRYVGAMSIRTGLSADGWSSMILRHCASIGASVEFVTGLGWSWYERNVLDYGFGYTRGHHTVYYRMLKQSAIQKHLKSVKVDRRDRIVYFVGVRKSESSYRSNAETSYRHGSRVTVNPLLHWSDADVDTYLRVVAQWWRNPYYETVGSSGDCLCGWTCRNTADDIVKKHPVIGGKLQNLSRSAVVRGLWSYGTRPESTKRDYCVTGDDMPSDSLCSNCGQ